MLHARALLADDPSAGVPAHCLRGADDNAENRVRDMDDEGTDAHFLIPTSWLSLVGVDDASIEIAMIRAYHRHMAEFCAPYPDRLKGPIVASTRRTLSIGNPPHRACSRIRSSSLAL